MLAIQRPAPSRDLRVLVACDGSPESLRACRVAASMLGSRADFWLVTVLSYELYPWSLTEMPLSDSAEGEERVDDAVVRAQAEAESIFTRAGGGVAGTYRFGRPAEEIAAEIEETSPDLVVIGSRALRAPKRWLGSVSESVLHHSKAAVLVVPADSP